ncbi:TPA: hypothetical protein G8W07_002865 [Salmonella enterica]|nr:hypothetical protein [Salmonella enterica]HAG2477555.1 hypothetical protein [Salmonella enterica]
MPLPLREYYPLDRAAELLECTVDDLIHWAKLNKINLCVMLENVIGYISIYDWRHKYEKVAKEMNLPAIDKTTSRYEQLLFSLKALLHSDSSNIRTIDKCHDLLKGCSFGDIDLIKYGFVSPEEGVFWSIDIDDYTGDCFDYIMELSNSESNNIKIHVTLSGFFRMFMYHSFFEDTILDEYLSVFSIDNMFDVTLLLDDHVYIDDVEFFILKSDFLKIKEASKNGDDIATDNYLWHKLENSDRINKRIVPRVSTPAKTAIKALIANHHSEIKENPAKVAEVLAAEARQAGLGDVNFDKNTVSNWLKES